MIPEHNSPIKEIGEVAGVSHARELNAVNKLNVLILYNVPFGGVGAELPVLPLRNEASTVY